jgi:MYXO-CTERM domain-containing protein
MKQLSLFGLFFALLFFTTQEATARPFRVQYIPNGPNMPTSDCSTCHIRPSGGNTRTPFGELLRFGPNLVDNGGAGDDKTFMVLPPGVPDVFPQNYVPNWGAALAATDPDGDGFTTGQELGDPTGLVWNVIISSIDVSTQTFTGSRETDPTTAPTRPGQSNDALFDNANPIPTIVPLNTSGDVTPLLFARPECGNGRGEGDDNANGVEACDDNNASDGDGCNSTCAVIEIGFSCVGTGVTSCAPICGDNLLRSNANRTEVCDDNNASDGDGCNSTCEVIEIGFSCVGTGAASCTPICGDNLLRSNANRTEVCDDNNASDGDGCNSACEVIEIGFSCVDTGAASCTPICGDNLLRNNANRTEVCDDNNASDGDGCNSTCEVIEIGFSCVDTGAASCAPICGDSLVRSNVNGLEVCDDGCLSGVAGICESGTDDGDGCRFDCTLEDCGDGFTDPQEQCDDGNNNNNNDGCLNGCIAATCGDGFIFNQNGGTEQCDDTNGNNTDSCTNACQNPRCGDGFTQPGIGETCDDANASDTDACLTTCFIATCSDGFIHAGVEACDDSNIVAGDGCRADCVGLEVCGDGQLDAAAGEQCDDGNTNNADACIIDAASGALCEIAICGDSFTQIGVEQCDDGNTNNADACIIDAASGALCEIASCGDSFTQTGTEQCDDGNIVAGDGCRADCAGDESCGDGQLDTVASELCDDNNTLDGDGCRADCLGDESCGDGQLDTVAGEVCDDGNIQAGDGCRADCLGDENCGDGQLDTVLGEQCDDSNTASLDGCDAICKSEVCGDGILNNGVGGNIEVCDDSNVNNGDGCSDTCSAEPGHFFEIEPNNSSTQANLVTPDVIIHGTVNSISDEDFFSFTLTATADVKLQTFDGDTGLTTCNGVDTEIALLGENGADILAENLDGGIPGCSLIDPLTDEGATQLPPGTYFARVRSNTSNPQLIDAYLFQLTIFALCGNNATEGSELCDDGNLDDDDGCSQFCSVEFTLGSKGGCAVEPISKPTLPLFLALSFLGLAFFLRRRR